MSARKQPTKVLHFTHIDHLRTIVERGLLSDTLAHEGGVLSTEVGNTGIKDRRRIRQVPFGAGGCVADYVPFYFAPRSPMMYAIANGNVTTYTGGTARLIYLVTSLERLAVVGCQPLLTDRNAALAYAEYRLFDPSDLLDDGFIDWEVMGAKYWGDFDDGRERRMAEALVHRDVPWDAVLAIVVQNEAIANEVRAVLASVGSTLEVHVRPRWYF